MTFSSILTLLLLLISSSNASSSSSLDTNKPSIESICKSTIYPELCVSSLKLSITIPGILDPTIITYLLQTLQLGISESTKLINLYSNLKPSDIIEKQRGTIQDCKELQEITVSYLQKSVSKLQSGNSRDKSDANAYLSAALTNKNTCLEGLDSATGPFQKTAVSLLLTSSKYIANSLSMLSKSRPVVSNHLNRRLLGFPNWMSRKSRRILQDDEYDSSDAITVAADGTGNFTTITDAIHFAPNKSDDRFIIYVRAGVYEENVEIPKHKNNIVLLGDGSDVTMVTGSRSVVDGWTTFRSATFSVSGEGFLARGITFENTAGAEKHQAVALRVSADLAAFYQCTMIGYQDTLYTHTFRQFYRECDIFGTVDFIFGNGAVVFQGCNIIARLPMAGQFNAITAHARDIPEMDTGFSIQNCSILAAVDLSENGKVKSYLGRPWKQYARTVYIKSYIDGHIDLAGWREWSGNVGLDTLYYGEYENYGPGSVTDNRVAWAGYRVMDYNDASNFTVSQFITGDEWLSSTSFPYDDEV
ncbi:pectinesterase [Ranunculus cassubicifolius]